MKTACHLKLQPMRISQDLITLTKGRMSRAGSVLSAAGTKLVRLTSSFTADARTPLSSIWCYTLYGLELVKLAVFTWYTLRVSVGDDEIGGQELCLSWGVNIGGGVGVSKLKHVNSAFAKNSFLSGVCEQNVRSGYKVRLNSTAFEVSIA